MDTPKPHSARRQAITGRTALSMGFALEELESRRLLAFDPTASEQYMMELLNRFRINPAAELGLLTTSLGTPARSSDPNVDNALRFFGTSGPVLAQQWATLSAAPPLAWNEDLYESGEFHNGEMIDRDAQEHEFDDGTTLVERVTNAGYTGYSALGESIYAYASSVLHGHAGFLLDWGDTPTGIQEPPGHRNSAISASYREVGIRIQSENNPATRVGPLVMTLEFGNRFAYGQAALLGVVYNDSDNNDFYTVGEGLGGITIEVRNTGNDFGPIIASTTTMSAGGYQLKLAAGIYNVTFRGGQFGNGVTHRNVTIGSQNAKLDAQPDNVPTDPEIEVWGGSGAGFDRVIVDGDTTPVKLDSTYWGDVNRVSTGVDRTFLIHNRGNKVLNLVGNRVRIWGSHSSEFTIVSMPEAAIAPGASTTFTVRYTPAEGPHIAGLRDAMVEIFSDDLDEATYNFAIRARVVAAPIALVKGNGATIANGDTTPTTADFTNFGGVNATDGTTTRALRLFNTGSANLNIQSILFEGDAAADFSLLPLPATTIAPGTAITFRIRFDPFTTGMRHATVRITTNDALRSPWTFAIRGNGLAYPEIEVRGRASMPIVSGSPAAANLGSDFGNLAVANRTLVREFSVANLGFKALNLLGAARVVISGPNAADFAVKLDASPTVAPSASSLFRIRFDPTAAGERTALVTIRSNDTNEGTYTFWLRGFGV